MSLSLRSSGPVFLVPPQCKALALVVAAFVACGFLNQNANKETEYYMMENSKKLNVRVKEDIEN